MPFPIGVEGEKCIVVCAFYFMVICIWFYPQDGVKVGLGCSVQPAVNQASDPLSLILAKCRYDFY